MVLGVVLASLHATGWAQERFATPEAAVQSLLQACKANDGSPLLQLFGSGSEDLVSSGNPEADRIGRREVVRAAKETWCLQDDGDRKVIVMGKEGWSFPVPLLRQDNGWSFDVVRGRQEVLTLRIGADELETISMLRRLQDAQTVYASRDRDGDGVLEFSSNFVSTPGRRDGLYWSPSLGEPSPLEEMASQAREYGQARTPDQPYYGYSYRILFGQGAAASGGPYDYRINGNLIGGWAIVAYPADYGKSGLTTFLINQNGTLFEKDLGSESAQLGTSMILFNPDSTWTVVK
jgi:hypothetical protein